MVRWKFKSFIIIYIILLVTIVVGVCHYVWTGLEKYQKNYDEEYACSNSDVVMETYIKDFDIKKIHELVENDGSVYLTEFEEIEDVISLYNDEFANSTFSFREEKEYSKTKKKVYSIEDENKTIIAYAIVTAEERTRNFGFNKWEIEDVILNKYYDRNVDIVLRVSDKASVAVNGIKITDKELYESAEDKDFDRLFSKEVEKYTDKYVKYKYYKVSDLYKMPEIEVTEEGKLIEAEIAADGTYNYEAYEDKEFVASVSEDIKRIEGLYGDYYAKYKTVDKITPYLVSGSSFYSQTVNSQSILKWNSVPSRVTYENWNITSVKKLEEGIFICDLSFLQKVDYGSVVREYENTFRALFVKQNGVWKLAYQKNK